MKILNSALALVALAAISLNVAVAADDQPNGICKQYPGKEEECAKALAQCKQYAEDDNIDPSELDNYLKECVDDYFSNMDEAPSDDGSGDGQDSTPPDDTGAGME
jgi:hypothetical protein